MLFHILLRGEIYMLAKTRDRGAIKGIMKNAEQLTIVRAIRGGLVNITPVLIIGAFALILKTFPVAAYQAFIEKFADGLLLSFLNFVYSATCGVLSVYMTISISIKRASNIMMMLCQY